MAPARSRRLRLARWSAAFALGNIVALRTKHNRDLIPAIEKVIADNAGVVAEYKGGKVTSLQFLIGQAMKATKGAGNPEVVRKLLVDRLS